MHYSWFLVNYYGGRSYVMPNRNTIARTFKIPAVPISNDSIPIEAYFAALLAVSLRWYCEEYRDFRVQLGPGHQPERSKGMKCLRRPNRWCRANFEAEKGCLRCFAPLISVSRDSLFIHEISCPAAEHPLCRRVLCTCISIAGCSHLLVHHCEHT